MLVCYGIGFSVFRGFVVGCLNHSLRSHSHARESIYSLCSLLVLLSSHRIASPSHRIASPSHRIASHRIASHRTASHRIASHRIASHRIASHRIASHRIASHRIASHRIASHRIASHRIASRRSFEDAVTAVAWDRLRRYFFVGLATGMINVRGFPCRPSQCYAVLCVCVRVCFVRVVCVCCVYVCVCVCVLCVRVVFVVHVRVCVMCVCCVCVCVLCMCVCFFSSVLPAGCCADPRVNSSFSTCCVMCLTTDVPRGRGLSQLVACHHAGRWGGVLLLLIFFFCLLWVALCCWLFATVRARASAC